MNFTNQNGSSPFIFSDGFLSRRRSVSGGSWQPKFLKINQIGDIDQISGIDQISEDESCQGPEDVEQ